jgi:hypothetical protein
MWADNEFLQKKICSKKKKVKKKPYDSNEEGPEYRFFHFPSLQELTGRVKWKVTY